MSVYPPRAAFRAAALTRHHQVQGLSWGKQAVPAILSAISPPSDWRRQWGWGGSDLSTPAGDKGFSDGSSKKIIMKEGNLVPFIYFLTNYS